jgi:hypothetical protein
VEAAIGGLTHTTLAAVVAVNTVDASCLAAVDAAVGEVRVVAVQAQQDCCVPIVNIGP